MPYVPQPQVDVAQVTFANQTLDSGMQLLQFALDEITSQINNAIASCQYWNDQCKTSVETAIEQALSNAESAFADTGTIISDNATYLLSAAQQYAALLGYTELQPQPPKPPPPPATVPPPASGPVAPTQTPVSPPPPPSAPASTPPVTSAKPPAVAPMTIGKIGSTRDSNGTLVYWVTCLVNGKLAWIQGVSCPAVSGTPASPPAAASPPPPPPPQAQLANTLLPPPPSIPPIPQAVPGSPPPAYGIPLSPPPPPPPPLGQPCQPVSCFPTSQLSQVNLQLGVPSGCDMGTVTALIQSLQNQIDQLARAGQSQQVTNNYYSDVQSRAQITSQQLGITGNGKQTPPQQIVTPSTAGNATLNAFAGGTVFAGAMGQATNGGQAPSGSGPLVFGGTSNSLPPNALPESPWQVANQTTTGPQNECSPTVYVQLPPPLVLNTGRPPGGGQVNDSGSGGGSAAGGAATLFTVDVYDQPHAFIFSPDDNAWKRAALAWEYDWLKILNQSRTYAEAQNWLNTTVPAGPILQDREV